LNLTVPYGEWQLKGDTTVAWQGTAGATMQGRSFLSAENVVVGAALSDASAIAGTGTRFGGNTGSTEFDAQVKLDIPVSVTANTAYKWGFRTESAAGGFAIRHFGSTLQGGMSYITAENTYL
jgi:hypothetical protein